MGIRIFMIAFNLTMYYLRRYNIGFITAIAGFDNHVE